MYEQFSIESYDTVDDFIVFGDLVVVRGRWEGTEGEKGTEPIQTTGQFMSLKRRQQDASWKTDWDIWDRDAPLPQPE